MKRFIKSKGFYLWKTKKRAEEEENKAQVGENEDNKLEDIEEEDDYGDEEGDIDPNENMPLVARVGMLSYEALKEKAKELGIPKYANIKREELQAKVVEALEKENAE